MFQTTLLQCYALSENGCLLYLTFDNVEDYLMAIEDDLLTAHPTEILVLMCHTFDFVGNLISSEISEIINSSDTPKT